MSLFVDTGVFCAHHDTDASRHETGTAALNAVLRSPEYGHVMTSDYIYNAAKNVAELYLRRGHQPYGRKSVSQSALKSGARTPS